MEVRGPRTVGRYSIFEEIASGGMATVHYGRLVGDAGFARTVAVKMLHPHLAKDPDFASMFLDEARLAARIRHPNVVQTLDVVAVDGELIHVMEYIHGESLHRALRAASLEGARPPLDVAAAILCAALHGLHAAHEATNDRGEPLNLVHRDVSPQNILVGADGGVRLLDFGVAKAAGRSHTTRDGGVKGKLGYMAPEQLHDKKLDRRTDVFASGIVLWETLTGRRLFRAETEAATVQKVLELDVEAPSAIVPGLPSALENVVMRALQRHPSDRFTTAREMALQLEAAVPLASATRIATWLEETVGDALAARSRTLARVEDGTTGGHAKTGAGDRPDEAATVTSRGETTEVSNLSLASTRRGPLRLPSRWMGYALVAVLAGGGGLLLSRVRTGAPAAGPPASVPANEPSIAPVVEAPPAVTSASASASTSTSTSTSATGKAAGGRATKPRPTPGAAATTKKPCVRSFVDDAGIKQYRDCP